MASSTQKSSKSQQGRSLQHLVVLVVSLLLLVVLAATILFTFRNNQQLEEILAESVQSELVSTCIAARDIIQPHMELFLRIHSQKDIEANQQEWNEVVGRLRTLCGEVGAEYIYALKADGGAYWFVFDTDETAALEHSIYTAYELDPVHEAAFRGVYTAGLMNADDEWGSYNTGAIPLYYNGDLVGIIATDITDVFIERSHQTSSFYATLLVIVMLLAMGVLIAFLVVLLKRNARMQAHLFTMANNDAITGLPNRYFLFNYLKEKHHQFERDQMPFALVFIDLDNFKTVNDNAGHDAGDDLLREISRFLGEYNNTAVCSIASPSAASESQDEEHGREGNAHTSRKASGKQKPQRHCLTPLTARIGGDEFLQLVPGASDAQTASRYAKDMLSSFMEQDGLKPFIEQFGVGLSIGVALFPSQALDYEELIRYADIAMYHSKNAGKHGFALYEAEMGDEVAGVELSVRRSRDGR